MKNEMWAGRQNPGRMIGKMQKATLSGWLSAIVKRVVLYNIFQNCCFASEQMFV